MRLQTGHLAPDFNTTDVAGTKISLGDYKNKYVLVSFFRYAGCPFCNLTLITLVNRYQNFANRGLKVVAFFQSDDESIDKYVSIKRPPFPVIADPEKKIYNLYGVERSILGGIKTIPKVPGAIVAGLKNDVVQGKVNGDGFLMPAQFIIGPDAKIITAYYGTSFDDKIPMIDIERLILTMPQLPVSA